MKEIRPSGDRGFILIALLFMLMLMAVTAVALNRRAATQARMSANQAAVAQIEQGQLAATEHMIWRLTRDPFFRTGDDDIIFPYGGIDYSCTVQNALVSDCTDAVLISVNPPDATNGITTAVRYYLYDLPSVTRPNHICRDSTGNIYIADRDYHTVWKLDAVSGEMIRVAGNGTSDFSGDYGPAIEACLRSPQGVFVDVFGVIYIADTGNNRIRKVDLGGVISTIAGTGSEGFSGDGGPAVSAELDHPRDVCVDKERNIYIADSDNDCIRKIDTDRIITTVAGRGEANYNDYEGGVSALNAKLDTPSGVFVDEDGNIYIADTGNHMICKVDTSDPPIVTRIAGCGKYDGWWPPPYCIYTGDGWPARDTRLQKPRGVYVDPTTGEVLVADTDGNRIRKFAGGPTDLMTTVAGTWVSGYSGDGGPATAALLYKPYSVVTRKTGEVVISDWMNSCLREVDLSGNIDTITSTAAPGFNKPHRICMDGFGNIYIADTENNQIRLLDHSWGVTTIAGTGSEGYAVEDDGKQAVHALLNTPQGVALDSEGHLYIADTENHIVRKVYMSGVSEGEIYRVAGSESAESGYNGDDQLAIDALLNAPKGISLDQFNNIYIADTMNCRVRKIYSSGLNEGKIFTVAGKGPMGGSDCGYDEDVKPADSAKLNEPGDVFALGSSGELYIADTKNNRIRKVDSAGKISTVAGTGIRGYSGDGDIATAGQLNEPQGVFVDSAGNVIIVDTGNHRIRVVSHYDSKIYTLAGNGVSGFNGDGMPAVETRLYYPSGIAMQAVRGGKKIYISDRDNNRIRMLKLRIEKSLY